MATLDDFMKAHRDAGEERPFSFNKLIDEVGYGGLTLLVDKYLDGALTSPWHRFVSEKVAPQTITDRRLNRVLTRVEAILDKMEATHDVR